MPLLEHSSRKLALILTLLVLSSFKEVYSNCSNTLKNASLGNFIQDDPQLIKNLYGKKCGNNKLCGPIAYANIMHQFKPIPSISNFLGEFLNSGESIISTNRILKRGLWARELIPIMKKDAKLRGLPLVIRWGGIDVDPRAQAHAKMQNVGKLPHFNEKLLTKIVRGESNVIIGYEIFENFDSLQKFSSIFFSPNKGGYINGHFNVLRGYQLPFNGDEINIVVANTKGTERIFKLHPYYFSPLKLKTYVATTEGTKRVALISLAIVVERKTTVRK